MRTHTITHMETSLDNAYLQWTQTELLTMFNACGGQAARSTMSSWKDAENDIWLWTSGNRSSPDQSESRNKSGENTQKRKAPKLNRPPRYTENPVTMYNKYGALDTEEGMESEIETGIG